MESIFLYWHVCYLEWVTIVVVVVVKGKRLIVKCQNDNGSKYWQSKKHDLNVVEKKIFKNGKMHKFVDLMLVKPLRVDKCKPILKHLKSRHNLSYHKVNMMKDKWWINKMINKCSIGNLLFVQKKLYITVLLG